MNSKVVSFQIVQGVPSHGYNSGWTPDVIALCEDGSLWSIGLKEFQDGELGWKRMTPEPPKDKSFMPPGMFT